MSAQGRQPLVGSGGGESCSVCGGRGWHTAGGNDLAACGACPAGEAWYGGDMTDAEYADFLAGEVFEEASDA